MSGGRCVTGTTAEISLPRRPAAAESRRSLTNDGKGYDRNDGPIVEGS
jgi:hypothetical protein